MKRFPDKIFSMLICCSLLCACEQNEPNESPVSTTRPAVLTQHDMPDDQSVLSGIVTETMDAGGYTYVQLDTDSGTVWAAGPVTPLTVGSELSISKEMPMSDFYSASLQRTFDNIYLVTSFTDTTGSVPVASADQDNPHSGLPPQAAITVTGKLEKAEGGKTISEILAEAGQLAGQTVRVRGMVVKLTPQVLGKDWIHISDEPNTDLTVTTTDSVAPGDLIVAEGVIATDKDFGHGYVYPIIMEDARIVIEE